MLRWLTRLFRQREAAETATAAPSPPLGSPEAAQKPTVSEIVSPGATQPSTATAAAEEPKETCPVCGRTSVFAGPPGQRFCTYCALRDELFEAKAVASE